VFASGNAVHSNAHKEVHSMFDKAATALPHNPGESGSARATTLVMSDFLFLGGLVLALFIVDDPYGAQYQHDPSTRHLPLLLSLAAILFASMGEMLRPRHARRGSAWPVATAGLPLLLLASWIVIGSLSARFMQGIADTFLNTGMYMMLTLFTARGILISAARDRVIQLSVRAMAVNATYMILRMIYDHDWGGGRYHEMEFVVMPVAVYYALSPSVNSKWRGLIVFFFLASGVVFCKNTGFIVMLLTLGYLLAVDWRFRLRRPARLYRVVLAGTMGLALALGGLIAFGPALSSDITLPNGNPGYRVRAYEKAISRFEQSPVYGVFFSERSTTLFTAFTVKAVVPNNQLPTHSDVLDLAANGGVMALALLVWAYARIARLFWRTELRGVTSETSRSEHSAAAHMFACMSLSAVAVYAVNPLMLQPDKGMLIWVSLGLLLGICLHRTALEETITGLAR
jgi:hypothetical protein